MHRRVFLATMILACTTPAYGQEWARKMFEKTSHDFGVVARGAKVEHRFVLENLYEEDVHIASVRSSCGCTTPQITRQDLKTWEQSEIVAVFNTRSFLGSRSATLTVVIDRPYYAEVQLHVSGYIRSDVVFDPGAVNFGELEQGSGGEVLVNVNYAGRPDWRIVDIRSANDKLEVELDEPTRRGGNISYRMLVRLKPDAPCGYLNDQLVLVTSDSARSTIPLAVEGRVRSALTVSPNPVILGVVNPGQQVTKKLLVRAKMPFRIVNVTCDGKEIQFEFDSTEAKTTHFIPLTFTAGPSGKVERTIRVETDLPGSIIGEVSATAEVKGAEVATPANDQTAARP